MRIVIVSSIFPPDIGGPATHAADLRDTLRRRGHSITIVTLTDKGAVEREKDLMRFPRRKPWFLRFTSVVRWLIKNRSAYDIIYATGLQVPAVIGARLARRPVVVKVVGDAVWERASRLGLTRLSFEEFQIVHHANKRVGVMRYLRNWSLRNADEIIVPSRYLAEFVHTCIGPRQIKVIPNGVTVAPDCLAEERPPEILKLAFVGRLVPHKRVALILDALKSISGVCLEVIGDGPARRELERAARSFGLAEKVTFHGVLARDEVLRHLASSHALISASSYEGLPHTAIESLAVGTPIIATPAGGTKEIVVDERNGLIITRPTAEGIARVVKRFRDDGQLRERLLQGARQDAVQWRFEHCADRLEAILRMSIRQAPRVVFLGKTLFPKPLTSDIEAKMDLIARHLRPTFIGVGPTGVEKSNGARIVRFPQLPSFLGTAVFYSMASTLGLLLAAGRRRYAIVTQSPLEGFFLAFARSFLPHRVRPQLVIEVHGDWRTAAKLYGTAWRRPAGPLIERMASWALHRADRVRVVSSYTRTLVVDAGFDREIDQFPAFSDYAMFSEVPLVPIPSEPHVAFVGRIERAKGWDVLLEAWALVVRQLPRARLSIAGDGSRLQDARHQIRNLGIDDSVRLLSSISRSQVRELLDQSCCLVVPSRSEGLSRVILEAMARARPVVATSVGGILEIVDDGRTGVLVPVDNAEELASALFLLLADANRLQSLGAEARTDFLKLDPIGEYERAMARLAAWVDTPQ